jgi:hypothetical protein
LRIDQIRNRKALDTGAYQAVTDPRANKSIGNLRNLKFGTKMFSYRIVGRDKRIRVQTSEMSLPENDAHLMRHAVVRQLNLIHAPGERFPINLD